MNDGTWIYYKIEFSDSLGRWREADLGHFIFHHMSWMERKSIDADRIRKLIGKENYYWQSSGIHGFEELADAIKAHEAVTDRCPDIRFRIVVITAFKRTEVITNGL